jgi:cellulose synthase/poly-beta-1,6-N-acetylglucosamine synthase-like glycosyltransferase
VNRTTQRSKLLIVHVHHLQSSKRIGLSTSFAVLLFTIFLIAAWTLTFYSLNFYFLVYYLSRKKRTRKNNPDLANMPLVTIQLPIYNEKYVASRLIEAVCKMDYPIDRLEIQVLDDSEDDSSQVIKNAVRMHKLRGFDIHYMTREDRSGFKAGALIMGTKNARGEFIAIFDADFVPPPEFLKKTLKYFSDSRIGLVQCRWGHINENYSALTEAQALSLDLHFLVEQNAKSLTHLFMNFNGTAGIWRASCIKDAGGWQTGTLVEDMDLSFRAQMRGWKLLFDENIVVSAELPVQMNAAKRQQFRWAKGTTQLAMKLLGVLLLCKKIPLDTKIQAFIQLTRHLVHPLFLAQFLIFPILLNLDYSIHRTAWTPYVGLIFYVLLGPVAYLYIIRRIWPTQWITKARQYWILLFFGAGISVNNTIAVFDALLGRNNEFLRTPKFGISVRSDKWKGKDYVLPFTRTTLLEIFFSLYGCFAVFVCIFSGNVLLLPIITLQTIGFVYVAYLSIIDSWGQTSAVPRSRPKISSNNMNATSGAINNLHNTVLPFQIVKHMTSKFRLNWIRTWHILRSKALLLAFIALLASGIFSAFYGYQSSIYPLDKATGYLSRAQSAQTPHLISSYLNEVKELIPPNGNPVWTFPNPKTDFKLISQEINAMQARALAISQIQPHSAAYNTALEDLHTSIRIIEMNLIEAQPYFYGSLSNFAFTGIWIGLILLAYTLIRRTKKRFSESELT